MLYENVKRSFDLLYAFLALLFQAAEAEDFVPIFVRVDARCARGTVNKRSSELWNYWPKLKSKLCTFHV